MTQIRQYPQTASVEDFLALLQDQPLFRLAWCADMALLGWLFFEDGVLYEIHDVQRSGMSNPTCVQIHHAADLSGQCQLLERHLQHWNVFPPMLLLTPIVMVCRKRRGAIHTSVSPREPEYMLGITSVLNRLLERLEEQHETVPNIGQRVVQLNTLVLGDTIEAYA